MNNFCTPENCEGCPVTIVCRCLKVTEAEVMQVISRLELRTIKDLQSHIGAGDGCTCCHPQLTEYLDRFNCVPAGVS